MMNKRKKKYRLIIFYIEPSVLKEIEELVKAGKYRSRSEFIIKAIQELIERMKRSNAVNIDVIDVLYNELLKMKNDGAIIFSVDIIKKIMQKKGLNYKSYSPSWLINSLKEFLRRRGWAYVGSFTIDGVKHHVFVRDANNVLPRVLEIINMHEQRDKPQALSHRYRNSVKKIVDYIMKNPHKFQVNPTGLFKISTKDMVNIAETLGIHNVSPSRWLVKGVMEELRNRGFEVRKRRGGKYVRIFFSKALPTKGEERSQASEQHE